MPNAKHSIRRTRNGAGPEAGSIIRRAGSFTARQSSQAGGQDGIGECSIIYEILRSKGGGTYRPRQPVSMRRCSPHVPITVGPRNRNLACTCTMCRVHWACAGLALVPTGPRNAEARASSSAHFESGWVAIGCAGRGPLGFSDSLQGSNGLTILSTPQQIPLARNLYLQPFPPSTSRQP